MSSDAIQAALAKAKGEAGTIEASKQAKVKADRTGKPVETASGAKADHPIKEAASASPVPTARSEAEQYVASGQLDAELAHAGLESDQAPVNGADPFTHNPDEVLEYAEKEASGELDTGVLTPADVGPATLVVDDVEIPVVIDHVDADGTPTLDEKSSKAVEKAVNKAKGADKSTGEVLTDRIKLQPPAAPEIAGEWGAFANFALLPPVNHNP